MIWFTSTPICSSIFLHVSENVGDFCDMEMATAGITIKRLHAATWKGGNHAELGTYSWGLGTPYLVGAEAWWFLVLLIATGQIEIGGDKEAKIVVTFGFWVLQGTFVLPSFLHLQRLLHFLK